MEEKKYQLRSIDSELKPGQQLCMNCIFYDESKSELRKLSCMKAYNCKHADKVVNDIDTWYGGETCDNFYPKEIRFRLPKEERKNLLPSFSFPCGISYLDIAEKSKEFILNFVSYDEALEFAKKHVYIETKEEDFGGVLIKTKKLHGYGILDVYQYNSPEEAIDKSKPMEIDLTLYEDNIWEEQYQTTLKRLTTLYLVLKYNEIAKQKNKEICEYHRKVWETIHPDKKQYLDAKLKEYSLPEDKD